MYSSDEREQIRKKLEILVAKLYPHVTSAQYAIALTEEGFKIEFSNNVPTSANKIIHISDLLQARHGFFFKESAPWDLISLFEDVPYIHFKPSQPAAKVLEGLDELIKVIEDDKHFEENFVRGMRPISVDSRVAMEREQQKLWLKENTLRYEAEPEDIVTTYLLRKARKMFPGKDIGVTHTYKDTFIINLPNADTADTEKRDRIYDFIDTLEESLGTDAVHLATISNNGKVTITITEDAEVLKEKINANELLENRISLLR